MELGSNSPLIVMPDADIDKVVGATVASGFANAGQVCISAQRIITSNEVYGDYLDALTAGVEAINTGNPLEEGVAMGPMVRRQDAERVDEWVKEAVGGGARKLVGGDYSGATYAPTVVADVDPGMRVSCEELFGPAVAVTPFSDVDEAIAMANSTNYGLSAGIFTQNVDWGDALRPGGRLRQPPHQLRPHVARRPHALRRPQGQRHGQGGPQVRRRGDDRAQDGRLPPIAYSGPSVGRTWGVSVAAPDDTIKGSWEEG